MLFNVLLAMSGLFTPRTVHPIYGHFAPWAIRPIRYRPCYICRPMSDSPIDVSPHVNGGETSIWANRQCGEMSSVWRNVHGTNRPYMGRNIHGANCPWGEKSINLISQHTFIRFRMTHTVSIFASFAPPSKGCKLATFCEVLRSPCLYVYPLAYFKNHMSKLREIFCWPDCKPKGPLFSAEFVCLSVCVCVCL